MPDLYRFARPWLFAMDAEQAHEQVLGSIDFAARAGLLNLLAAPRHEDPYEILGLTFPNRVGLAAGLDKNAAHIDALGRLGFGFIEVGTVTPLAQPGNPKPRMFRLPEYHALINRLGFNNQGVEAFLHNVKQSNWIKEKRGLIGLNIGKNAATPIEHATRDYMICLEKVYPFADYITVNISSPNTKNLRQLQGEAELHSLLGELKTRQMQLASEQDRKVPMLVKIAPDLDNEQIEVIASALCKHQIDGVIATNTTVSREAVKEHPYAQEAGGLSGAPVLETSNQVIRQLRAALPSGYPIIGVGGILTGQDARSKIEAGANLVQLYTGLIYRGPRLVREAAQAISDKLR